MIRRILFLACLVLACLGNEGEAIAQASATQTTEAQWCYNLSQGGNKNAIVSPLVECLTDTQNGFFPMVTSGFFASVPADYNILVNAMFLIAIAFFGVKLMMGGVQRLKTETLVLGLKLGGILFFMNNAYSIYIDMLNILESMSQLISNAATNAHSTGFCVNTLDAASGSGADVAQWQNGLWARWDCILGFILGWGGTGFAVSSMASFLFIIMGSMGIGVLVFFVAIYLIFAILFAAARFIHIYLMSVLALSFLFCLGFIFVPLLLFNNTKAYFEKWLSLVFSFVLTPVIMFGFMGMMLVALDITVFTGKYSIYCTIGGTTSCSTATAGATLFSNLTGNVNYKANSTSTAGNSNLTDGFKEMFMLGLNGPGSMQNVGDVLTSGPTLTNMGAKGFTGKMTNTGSSYDTANHPEMARMGWDGVKGNLQKMASAAGGTCNAPTTVGTTDTTSDLTDLGSGTTDTTYTNCPWAENVLISFCVAALLVYIMYSLLDYIPSLASDLASQGLSSAGATFGDKNNVFGQGMFNQGLDKAKSGTSNILSKFKSGGINSALSGRGAAGNQGLMNQMNSMVQSRDD